MIKAHYFRLYIISFLIFLSHVTFAQEKAFLISDNIAVFYPVNYIAEKHNPSFALIEEPEIIDTLPYSWDIKVEFGEEFEKSMAYIKTRSQTWLYGTGESRGNLVKNGETRIFWNTDNPSYDRDSDGRLYQTHPWVLGVHEDGSAFGVLADNTWKQKLSLGDGIVFISDGPPFRVFVIRAATPQKVIQILAALTGKINLPPLWSLGYQQCRWSYYPDTRVKEIADTFRLKQIPCDVIWMDIHYMDGYRVFTFDPERFPNPSETNDYLHSQGFKSVWMIDPGVKKEEGYTVYDSGTENDVWVKDANGDVYVGPVWPGDCVFPDFTQEKTSEWWADLYKDYMNTGIDGVWNDMNEPSVFGGPDWTMPIENIHRGGAKYLRDIHLRYHNVYGMLMVKASRKGILDANPDKRPFILTRANYIGGQRYAATWTGDNVSSWDHLRMSIPMSINLGLSGQPFNGPDIGGFDKNATPELFGHWIAVGAFYPFSRGHTVTGSINHEPWAFGEEIEDVSRVALQRRYRLLPYLYTLFYEASVNGMPVMRPVFFADITDIKLRREEQAFLLGTNLLVIPKWADHPALPKGIWRTISLVGEDSENDIYQTDLKQRGGSIIPLIDVIQTTEQYSTDSLTLLVCLDENMKAEGTLYSDAGDEFEYLKGQYAVDYFIAEKSGENKIIITCSRKEGHLKEEKRYYRIGIVTDSGIVYSEWKNKKKIEISLQ
ncbi:MAG: DUF5110 domain-containing protein [Bacteroidales bacterium]|nr:DUF5110 domain-containing protein [Bacteroidales bacterium]